MVLTLGFGLVLGARFGVSWGGCFLMDFTELVLCWGWCDMYFGVGGWADGCYGDALVVLGSWFWSGFGFGVGGLCLV